MPGITYQNYLMIAFGISIIAHLIYYGYKWKTGTLWNKEENKI